MMEIGLQRVLPRRRFTSIWLVFTVLVGAGAGLFTAWRAPSLNLYAQDHLMRSRGVLSVPDDIVIVAIDDASVTRLGRFPWGRGSTARVIDKISSAAPKAIGLDVLYSEPSDETADRAVANSIKKAGNVVVSEQLIEGQHTQGLNRSVWLKSLSEIEAAAAGVGHVNVETETDGAAREILLKLADDNGDARWALAMETVRVGSGLGADNISETDGFVQLGTRKIPIDSTEPSLIFKNRDADSHFALIKPLRMAIDYVGPTGSFVPQTYSFADVLEGKIAPEKFHQKYVLIGATAATLGDRISTPFVHAESSEGDQHGDLMPGVEILANSIDTILRGRFYRPVSDWITLLCGALVAVAVIILLGLAQGEYEAVKQVGVLAGLLALIFFGSYFIFVYGLIVPPLVPMLASFIVAAPLALLRRSLAASINLDDRIAELAVAERSILSNLKGEYSSDFIDRRSDKRENLDESTTLATDRFFLPRGLEWKTQALGMLSRDIIARALFIDSALRSIKDGLLIADRDGLIVFANQSASRIFDLSEQGLLGRDILDLLLQTDSTTVDLLESREELLRRIHADHEIIEREISVDGDNGCFYILRMAAVEASRESVSLEPPGFIVTLFNVTQHRELQKTKNDVITLVTHELRTPLTAIQGMSEVLTEHDVEPEPQRRMLQTINTEAKRLAQMINEYLDITRLEAGAQKVNLAPVNVESLIERTLLMLEPLAAGREITILRSQKQSRAVISADAERLAQMLTNIVGNAIKYSPPNTSITIETTVEGSMSVIKVADEGCGISAEQLPLIFEKFYRAPQRGRTYGSEVSGTGLGLALSKEIAELHDGRIIAESELGKGSVFTIFLPVTPPDKIK